MNIYLKIFLKYDIVYQEFKTLCRKERIMERVVNEEKRKKFVEFAGKRVNNVLHDIQILEPMARSNSYDFTRKDVEDMFNAMQETLNEAKEEFNKKFDEKARAEKKVFSFSDETPVEEVSEVSNDLDMNVEENSNNNDVVSFK